MNLNDQEDLNNPLNMNNEPEITDPFDEYRQHEKDLRLELMNICKRYIRKISIVSAMGVLDLVKQEILELEQVTKSDLREEENINTEQSFY